MVLPPQKKNSVLPGSPIGHRQVCSVSSRMVRRWPIGMMFSISLRRGFGLDFVGVRERRVAANGVASDPQHVRRRACFALPRGGAGRSFGAAGEAEPMDLADDCIAGDAAELGSDLTG